MLLFIVFISAFGAATILPLSSEVAVVVAYQQGESPLLIWLLASIGNTLGSIVNYVLARYLMRFSGQSWFPVAEEDIQKGSKWFQRYGVWSLLFSWAPVVGDALTFIAGALKVRFYLFFLLVVLGKTIRYGIVILALMQFI